MRGPDEQGPPPVQARARGLRRRGGERRDRAGLPLLRGEVPPRPARRTTRRMRSRSSAGRRRARQLGAPFADPLPGRRSPTRTAARSPRRSPGSRSPSRRPASGPSGTFSASGSNEVLVGTNASGAATAPQFTANRWPGGYLVVASSDYGSVSFSLVNTASGIAATITPGAPASQSATVGGRLRAAAAGDGARRQRQPGRRRDRHLHARRCGQWRRRRHGCERTGCELRRRRSPGDRGDERRRASRPRRRSPRTRRRADSQRPPPPRARTTWRAFSLDNLAGKPPTVKVGGNAKQSATVGADYAKPLRVKVPRRKDGRCRARPSPSPSGPPGAAAQARQPAPVRASPAAATRRRRRPNAAGVATSPRFDREHHCGHVHRDGDDAPGRRRRQSSRSTTVPDEPRPSAPGRQRPNRPPSGHASRSGSRSPSPTSTATLSPVSRVSFSAPAAGSRAAASTARDARSRRRPTPKASPSPRRSSRTAPRAATSCARESPATRPRSPSSTSPPL